MNPPTKTKEKQKTKGQSDDSIPSFIRKTYEILEEGKHADVIRWSDDGTAIVISNPTEFAQKVLPIYFKHNNLTSFIRQLNMYDFHKKRSLNMDHVYCHELFQRGKKHLLKEIRRKNSESVTSGVEKGILPLPESSQSKQDLAAVVHENVLLKKYNQDTLNRVTLLETQLKEKNIENQTLWRQIFQLREKEDILKSVIVNFMKQNGLPIASLPPLLQNEFDYTTFTFKPSAEQKDNSPTFLAQTTTKMHFPTPNMAFSQTYQNPQQDLQKNMNSLQMLPQPDTMGNNNQALYFDLNKGKMNDTQMVGGLGDNRYVSSNFGTNFSAQALDPWGLGFGNFKPLAAPNVGKPFGDINTNIDYGNLGKRKGGEQDDPNNYHKKFKQNPSLNDGNFKMKPYNKEDAENHENQYMQFNQGTLGNNMLLNVKDEGKDQKVTLSFVMNLNYITILYGVTNII